ncbi:hypothetical protein WQ57_21125 [Mesobacillus campisalis]|uniref:Uncharacterized protein n=1 Tax=Mesobacillus campisalis TaxID=1408103 RepID=A0A0M2SU10_9BACI|nr:hypothetical protein [Mesobacillus campisalis]KKK36115.1 hypothetical protein WQ57_21125 [Mesobacillus campisalis]
MKKTKYFISIMLIIFIGYFSYYITQYDIKDKKTDIQSNLMVWINRGSPGIIPEVIDVVQLGDTSSHIVLLQIQNGSFGYAHLIKGWNGKFKIDHSGHGTNIVHYQEIQTNNGMYGVLVGRNPDLKIDHIVADLFYEDFSFISNVNAEEKFVRYKKFSKEVKKTFPAELTYYNNNGTVIEVSDL